MQNLAIQIIQRASYFMVFFRKINKVKNAKKMKIFNLQRFEILYLEILKELSFSSKIFFYCEEVLF